MHAIRLVTAAALAAALSAQMPAASAPQIGRTRTIQVAPGDDLQAVLDAARPGDTISLEAGGVYRGPFVLRAKNGDEWIVVSSNSTLLPPEGTRVTPANTQALAVLESADGPVLQAEPGAHHVRLIGLEIRPAAGSSMFNVIEFGSGDERVEAALPHDLRLERSYVHGEPSRGTRRGLALNGRAIAVVDSYFSDFKEVGADSQAIAGWNGPGPFEIVNNHLEGAGENLMFGGADPVIRDLVPSDIQIRRNHLVKPVTWKADEPGFKESRWSVKNILELKNARRVVIEGNVLEQNWPDAQNGFAVLFTVRNQDGAAPWSVVEDVRFANNILRNTASAINVLGRDDSNPSEMLSRVTIANNLIVGVGEPRWNANGGTGRFLQLLTESRDVVVEHNTIVQTGNAVTVTGKTHTGFVFRNNIVRHNDFGIIGDGRGVGLDSIGRFLPGAVIAGNVFVNGDAGRYPPDNLFVSALTAIGFVDPTTGNYQLSEASPFRRRATDGTDPGVDWAALSAAVSGVAEDNPQADPCDRPLRLKMPPCPEAP